MNMQISNEEDEEVEDDDDLMCSYDQTQASNIHFDIKGNLY